MLTTTQKIKKISKIIQVAAYYTHNQNIYIHRPSVGTQLRSHWPFVWSAATDASCLPTHSCSLPAGILVSLYESPSPDTTLLRVLW